MAAQRKKTQKVATHFLTVEAALRDLLYRGAQGTQADIAEELTAALGIPATQSSISRALKRLRAVKYRNGQGKIVWHLPQDPSVQRASGTTAELVVDIMSNGWLIVVHTAPGAAARVAYYLDRTKPGGIIGTVAGDDTIFIAPPAGVNVDKVLKDVRSSFRS